MILSLEHRHSGARHDVTLVDTLPGYRRALSVRFAFEVLTLDLESNELLLYKGNRIVRRFPWRAAPSDLIRLRALHFAMCRQKGDRTRRRAL